MSARRATDQVLNELRELLRGGQLEPGQRLPTERVLADQFGVNRTTLRKALALLEAEGAVTRHVGRGTFVGTLPEPPEAIASKASPIELMDARLALEPVIAREAALRARKEDLQRLNLCLVRSEAAADYEGFEEWDVAFHSALADATQNPIFGMVVEIMRQMRVSREWHGLKRASFQPELRSRYETEHRAILHALEMRDQAGAAAAMFQHMQTVRNTITGGVWSPSTKEIALPVARQERVG